MIKLAQHSHSSAVESNKTKTANAADLQVEGHASVSNGGGKVRQTANVRIEKGVVFLRCRTVPSPACTLLELSADACRCNIPLNKLDAESAARLKSYLILGRELPIDISAPPYLPGVHLDAAVESVQQLVIDALELKLVFRNIEPDERDVLIHALHVFENGNDSSANSAAVAPKEKIEPTIVAESPRQAGPFVNPFPPPKAPDKPIRITLAQHDFPVHDGKDPYRGKRVGEILLQMGKTTESQVNEAYAATHSVGEKLGQYLLRSGWITPMDLCSALALQTGLPIVDLSDVTVPPDLAAGYSYLTMLRYEFVPFEETADALHVAAAHPLSSRLIMELAQKCKKRVKVFLAEDDVLIKHLYALQPKKDRKLRRQRRYSINLPVKFHFFNRQQEVLSESAYYGKTVDLSENGLMICTTENMKGRGACVHFSCSLPPQHVEGICSVRYHKDRNASGGAEPVWLMGLQIIDMTPENRSRLKELCMRVGMWNKQDRQQNSKT